MRQPQCFDPCLPASAAPAEAYASAATGGDLAEMRGRRGFLHAPGVGLRFESGDRASNRSPLTLWTARRGWLPPTPGVAPLMTWSVIH